MKIISTISLFISLPILLAGCGKDNYDAPQSTLSGKITYDGQALNVRGTDQAIRLQLFQDGFGKHDPIDVFVGQEGTFSAKLFNGEYKMVTRDGNGPWVNSRDTTLVTVKGATSIELKVTPYFTISDDQISLSGSSVNAAFKINQVVPDTEIEKVMLILSNTQFVDDKFNIAINDGGAKTNGSQNLTLNISNNSNVTNAKFLYARIGVKAAGADEAIYSPVKQLR